MVTLQQRLDHALSLRKQGFNCAQCVAMTFNPELETAAAGLGTGIAATGHVCGCVNALAMVTAAKSYNGPAEKQALYARIRPLIEQFAAENEGCTDCRDLRKPGRKPCTELIKDAVKILHEAD